MPIYWILNMPERMNSIDFFDSEYIPSQEKTRNQQQFGICDSSTGACAYTSLGAHYDCLVINQYQKAIQFIPIDHNIHFFDKNIVIIFRFPTMRF